MTGDELERGEVEVVIDIDEDDLTGAVATLEDDGGLDPIASRVVYGFWWLRTAIALLRMESGFEWAKTTTLANVTINSAYKARDQR